MSIVLQAHSLGFSAGRRVLFDGLDLSISTGERLALVGYNGCGKSTLLNMLAGELVPDSGHISRIRGLSIARVEQFLPHNLQQRSLREVLENRLTPDERWRADEQLSRLGFTQAQMQQTLKSLSGGQLNRLMLARALVVDPQLLLLDEPTNHLDLATLALFERVLAGFSGALLVVSHDRAFLDNLCPITLILRDQKLYRFELRYSGARTELERMDETAAARREAEEKKISKTRASAKRLADWGRTYDNPDLSRRANNMFKRVKRMEADRTFVSKGSPLDLDLSVRGSKRKRMLTLESLEVIVPGRTLFNVIECYLRPGERIALLGHNGVGKTTLIKAILDRIAALENPDATEVHSSSQIRISPQARLGYYDQELKTTDSNVSLFEFVRRDVARDDQGVVSALVAAGFNFEVHSTPVSRLSGGERARALFIRLSMQQPNLLILDEPTNHIDIDGREQLEAQLLTSQAAVLFTSHDREFVRTIAQRYWIIESGELLEDVDADRFFASAQGLVSSGEMFVNDDQVMPGTENAQVDNAQVDINEDVVLERIDHLEKLLAEDEARKGKFQKPKLQKAWREELETLNLALEKL